MQLPWRAWLVIALAVGGAASLKTPAGIDLLDSPEFPAAFEPFKPGIRGTRELYYLLKKEPGLDWVFLSPSVMITPGQRTNKFRLGNDFVLYDEHGKSHISLEDYAVAIPRPAKNGIRANGDRRSSRYIHFLYGPVGIECDLPPVR